MTPAPVSENFEAAVTSSSTILSTSFALRDVARQQVQVKRRHGPRLGPIPSTRRSACLPNFVMPMPATVAEIIRAP